MRNIFNKLNWKIILIHLLGFFFTFHSFKTFAFLYQIKFVEVNRDFLKSDQVATLETYTKRLRENDISSDEFANIFLIKRLLSFAGILIALTMSLLITLKQKFVWINSLVVSLISFIIFYFQFSWFEFLNKYLWILGKLFENIKIEFLFNGTLFFTLGIFVFWFSKYYVKNRSQ